jgi:hypothetical protein
MVCDSKQNKNNRFFTLSSIDSFPKWRYIHILTVNFFIRIVKFSVSPKVMGKKSRMDWSSRFCEPQAISQNRVARITSVDNIDGEMIYKWKLASNTNKHFIFLVLASISILVVHCCQLQVEPTLLILVAVPLSFFYSLVHGFYEETLLVLNTRILQSKEIK